MDFQNLEKKPKAIKSIKKQENKIKKKTKANKI